MTDTAWKSGIRRGRPAVTDPDLRLDRARPVDDPDEAARRRGRIHDRGPRLDAGSRHPAAEQALGDGRDVLARQVPADDERRLGRIEPAQPGTPQRLGVEALDGVAGPARRPVVGRRRRVDRADQGFLDPSARVGLGLEQVVEALVAEAVDLGDREGRMQDDLGQQVERLREPIGGHVQPGGQRVPAGLGVERRTQPLGRLDQGDRVVALRPLGQGPGRQDRRAGLVGRLVDRADRQDQRGRHQRPTGQVRDEDAQARCQPSLGDRRELVQAGRPGDGSLGDDRPVAPWLGRGRHAASSSESRSSRAWSSAAGPSGRYVSTTRLSTRNTSVAATRMSSAVTAR